jgi:hypothetical protein
MNGLRATLITLVFLGLTLNALHARAGVFGDGDPANGDEDDRRTLSQGASLPGLSEWYRSGGSIFCDGAVRGSATIVDLSAFAPPRPGVVIATAAHVLVDLDTGLAWNHCEYRHQGLGELPGYQATLELHWTLAGPFDARLPPGDAENAVNDWAFVWLGASWRQPGGARALGLADVRQTADGRGLLGLLAWNPDLGQLALASGCRAVLSRHEDLSGDGQGGQLLDDCDSGTGSSGGGLILTRDGSARLVGIRGGQHWDGGIWPPERYPDGPPAGSRWDPNRFTNYARALDADILQQVQRWWRTLGAAGSAEVAP